MPPPARDLVFISYSHAHKRWLDRLQIFLKPYTKEGVIEVWADPYIKVGDRWRREIGEALERTRVAVLLLTPEFGASDFIVDKELPPLLRAAEQGEVVLVCVPISAGDYKALGLAEYQWPLSPEQPLDRRSKPRQNEALVRIAQAIRDAALPAAAPEPTEPALPEEAPPESRAAAIVEAKAGAGQLGELYGVPSQRPHYLERTEELEGLKQALLSGAQAAVGITGSPYKVGLHGMGGIGKSVLAIAAVNDTEVRQAFPDGVLWVTLSQRPDLPALQARLVGELDGDPDSVRDVESGKSALRKLLREKTCLVVLDDLWQARHAEAFDILGPGSRLLATTRDAGLLTALEARQVRVDVLGKKLALQLLAEWSGGEREELPEEADRVAASCGRLPLALSLAAAQVLEGASWADVLEALERGDLEFLDHPYGSIFKSMRLSIDALPEETAARYLELAVFPEDVHVPVSTVERLWAHTGELEPGQTRRLLGRLESQALLFLSDDDSGPGLSFHDLQHDFLRLVVEDVRGLHAALLDAHVPKAADGDDAESPPWWRLADDEPYLWDHLANHLIDAGREDELAATVKDFRYLRQRIFQFGPRALETDVEATASHRPGDPGVEALFKELPPIAHLLAGYEHNTDLGAALAARLGGNDGLRSGAEAFARRLEGPWLRPLWPLADHPEAGLQRVLEGHTDWVRSVAVLPDGRVVSGSDDHTLRVWDPESGETVRTLEGHARWVSSVAVLPDGRVVSGSHDNTLRVWDPESGETVRTLEGHTGGVSSVAVLPDGRVVSGSADNTLRVWDPESGETVRTLEGHTGRVRSVAVLPDGRVVSGSDDNTLRVWDPESGETVRTLEGHTGWVLSVAVLPDGRVVSGSNDHTLRVWDPESGETVRTLEGHTRWVRSVAALPDGRVVSGSDDHTLRVWDPESGETVRTLEGHTGRVRSVAVLPDGRVVSGSDDHTLRVWDPESGETVRTIEGHVRWVRSVAVLPDGRVVSGSDDNTLRVWDPESGETVRTLEGHTGWVLSVAVLPDGRVVSGSNDHTLRVWDPESGETVRTLEGHTRWVRSVAALPDGRVVSGSDDNTLRVWDPESGETVRTIEGHTGRVRSVAVLPDGRVVSGSDDKTLRVWDPESGETVRTIEGHVRWVRSVAVLPDGRVVSGSDDNTLRVWDPESGETVRTLEGHTGGVSSVAVLPDGRVVSGSYDKTLRAWDPKSGLRLATLRLDAAVTSLAPFSAGLRFAAGAGQAVFVLELVIPGEKSRERGGPPDQEPA